MRQIKFRVWHINDKCYYDIHMMGLCGRGWKIEYVKEYMMMGIPDVGVMYEFGDPYEPGGCDYKTPFILEQFTGLKDKNGKEIYEGDVVHITRGIGNFANKKGAVIFTEGAFHIEGQGFTLSFANQYGLEITGNIHESEKS